MVTEKTAFSRVIEEILGVRDSGHPIARALTELEVASITDFAMMRPEDLDTAKFTDLPTDEAPYPPECLLS